MVRCITCNVFHMQQFCKWFYCLAWFYTVEFNRLPCPTRCTMMRFLLIDSAINWPFLKFVYCKGYLDSFMLILHKNYILPKSSQHSTEFPIVCMIWYCWIQSSAMFKQQAIRWCGFIWSIPLLIGYVWNTSIDMANLTPSCSYCIYKRWCQNQSSILPNFLLFAWFYTVEFNRRRCWNNKMYDDMVFNDWFWYRLTMFEVCIFTGLSRILDTHIAYDIAI